MCLWPLYFCWRCRIALGRVIAHNVAHSRHQGRPLCDTTHCQVFKGTDGRLTPSTIWRLLRRHKYIDQARLLLLGIDARYRTAGLYPLLVYELHRQAAAFYKRVEFSWVLEDNRDINQPAEQVGARRYQTYRIYQKAI